MMRSLLLLLFGAFVGIFALVALRAAVSRETYLGG